VTILKAGHGRITATVHDVGRWTVRLSRGAWSCSCPLAMPCPHAAAVAAVSDLPPSARNLFADELTDLASQ
jgi:hypothetical protein